MTDTPIVVDVAAEKIEVEVDTRIVHMQRQLWLIELLFLLLVGLLAVFATLFVVGVIPW